MHSTRWNHSRRFNLLMQYMASNKQIYTFFALIVIGALYYVSQIKEGVRNKKKKSEKVNKPTGVRTTSSNTSKVDVLKNKMSSLVPKWG